MKNLNGCLHQFNEVHIILLKLMDLYHCPRRGVFPIDGDCERFLMCREDSRNDGRIKGKVYRCPKGINNNWNSNSLQHFIMIRLLVLL